MLKLLLLSDLHLESHPYWDYIPKNIDNNTILVLAGDIMAGLLPKEFASEISKRFSKVIYIFGNHEYYGQDINDFSNIAKDYLSKWPNIIVLDNETTIIDNIKFIGSTLWTDMERENPIAMINIQRNLNDYHVIGDNKKKLHPQTTIDIHKRSVKFIENELQNDNMKKVVITHHCPSYMSVHNKFRQSNLNGAFCSSLDALFRPEYNIRYWLHGHTHQRVWYDSSNVPVRNNPKGYGQENPYFDPKMTFEV